jgi:hypothetical protein
MADKKRSKKKSIKKKKKKKLDKFHYHEALDRTDMMQSILQDGLADHPVISQNATYTKFVKRAQRALGDLYQLIGSEH